MSEVTGHRRYLPLARVCAHTRVKTVTCGDLGQRPVDIQEQEEQLVHAIKDMLDARELGLSEWAEFKRTHVIETWDLG